MFVFQVTFSNFFGSVGRKKVYEAHSLDINGPRELGRFPIISIKALFQRSDEELQLNSMHVQLCGLGR